MNIINSEKFTKFTNKRHIKYMTRGFGFGFTDNIKYENFTEKFSLLGICKYMNNIKNTNIGFKFIFVFNLLNEINEYYNSGYTKQMEFEDMEKLVENVKCDNIINSIFLNSEKEIHNKISGIVFRYEIINKMPFMS